MLMPIQKLIKRKVTHTYVYYKHLPRYNTVNKHCYPNKRYTNT